MNDDNCSNLDVMILDEENSDVVDQFHSDLMELYDAFNLRRQTTKLRRRKSSCNSTSSTSNDATSKSSFEKNLAVFESILPYDVHFDRLSDEEHDRYFDVVYDHGCKLLSLIVGDVFSEAPTPEALSNAEQMRILKKLRKERLGVSPCYPEDPDSPSTTNKPTTSLLQVIQLKGIADVLSRLRRGVLNGEVPKEKIKLDSSSKNNMLTPAVVAKLIAGIARMTFKYRASRLVESQMAVAQEDAGNEIEDEQLEEEYMKCKYDTGLLCDANKEEDETEILESVKRLAEATIVLENQTIRNNSLLELACNLGFPELLDLHLKIRGKAEFDNEVADSTPMIESAAAGTVNVLQKLIDMNEDVNCKSRNTSSTPLIYASVAGNVECVRALLATGRCSLSVNNMNGHDALMEASNAGQAEIVQLLLAAGAKSRFLNLNTEFKESALTLAAYKGHLDIVKILLDDHNSHPPVDDEQKLEREEELHTALMEASMDGHIDVAKLLLENGAPVNLISESFESPLTLACCGGHPALADLLLNAGANIEEKNDESYTPLMEASREGHYEVVQVLLKHGAEVNIKSEVNGDTALSVAACGGFNNIIKLLLAHGGDILAGVTPPIVEAAQEGILDTVELILSHVGADKIPNEQLNQAFHGAVNGGHRNVAKVLLNAGADVNSEVEGMTALMRAAKNDYMDIVEELIQMNVPVNYRSTSTDETAISMACAEGNTEVVKVLLKNGADPYLEYKEGVTCFFEASRSGNADLMSVLIEYSKKHLCKDLERRCAIPKAKMAATKAAFKKTAQRKRSSSGSNYNLSDLIILLDNKFRKRNVARTLDVDTISTTDFEILEQIYKIQLHIAKVHCHRYTVEEVDEARNDVCEILKALKTVYGLKPEGKINFPSIPPAGEWKKNAAVVKKWADVVTRSWLEMQNTCKDLIELATTTAMNSRLGVPSAAIRAAARAKGLNTEEKGYLASVFNKMSNGEAPRVPATVSSFDSGAATMDEYDDMKAGKRELRKKESLLLQEQALSDPLMRNVVHQIFVNISMPEESCSTHSRGIHWKAVVKRDKKFINFAQLAAEFETNYHVDKKEENRVTAVACALIALNMPMGEKDAADIELCEKIFSRFFDNCSPDDAKMTVARAGAVIESGIFEPMIDRRVVDECNRLMKYPGDKFLKSFMQDVRKKTKLANRMLIESNDLNDMIKKEGSHQNFHHLTDLSDVDFMPEGDECTAHVMRDRIKKDGKEVKRVHQKRRTHSEGDDRGERRAKNNAIDKATDLSQETPLSIACTNGHKDVVELLIREGANIEHRDKKGFTPLIIAATAGHTEIVELLLKNHANVEAQSDRTKDTALSLACGGGRKEIVQLLLQNNANKEHRNVSDYTPLSLAASGGYVEIVNMLLNAGAEINSRTGSKLGISPLMLAAMNGHKEATRILLEKGSDINAQIETNRNTALTLACFQGRTEVAEVLLEYNANVEHRAKTGLTPLMEAANGGFTEVGSFLLKFGADPNAAPVPSSRDTALTIAADKGHDKFVELLLKANAQIDARNKKGCTALWLACHGGHTRTAEVLLKYRADADAVDHREVSPLMAAFKKGHIEIVKLMVSKVRQLPSDQDCVRTVDSAENASIMERCLECASIIDTAMMSQAESAEKAAADLLALLEEEEEQARSKKQKQQEKKKKKKEARKTKKVESPKKIEPLEVVKRDEEVEVESMKPKKPIIVHISAEPQTINKIEDIESDEWVKAKAKKQKANKKRESSATSSIASDYMVHDMDVGRKKIWSISVGSSIVARVIGRGGANINAVREATGASIEVEKQDARKGPLAERKICVRGQPDMVKNASQMIQMLITDNEAMVNDVIRNVLKGNTSVASSVSSDGGGRNEMPPLPTLAKSLTTLLKVDEKKEEMKKPKKVESTGNVWQQRMAARQQEIEAKKEESVSAENQLIVKESLENPPAVKLIVDRPLLENKTVEKTSMENIIVENPISKPKKLTHEEERPQQSVAPQPKVPIAAVVQPIQKPIFVPPPPPSSSSSSIPLTATTKTPESVAEDMAKLKVFEDSKLAEIWGKTDKDVPAWGSQLFTTLPTIDPIADSPIFDDGWSKAQDLEAAYQQKRQLELMQEQHDNLLRRQTLLNQMQTSLSEQVSTANSFYNQLAAQLLTHQESSNPMSKMSSSYAPEPTRHDTDVLSRLFGPTQHSSYGEARPLRRGYEQPPPPPGFSPILWNQHSSSYLTPQQHHQHHQHRQQNQQQQQQPSSSSAIPKTNPWGSSTWN